LRILLIHADSFSYEVREKAIDHPEPLTSDRAKGFFNEVLVVFVSVEKGDELNIGEIVDSASKSIIDVAERVGAKSIVLYPYAHLSSNLAPPKVAIDILVRLEENLRGSGVNVYRSPFGWYKQFEIKCKGHPLSELSRSIVAVGRVEREEVKLAEAKPSRFIVLDLNGVEHPITKSSVEDLAIIKNYPLLKQFILSEFTGGAPGKAPTHIKLMRRLELVDYEPASDIGHFRFYPKGALLKRLLEEFAFQVAVGINAMVIETPVMYRLDEKDISEQASRFLEKDYRFEADGKKLVLRFAGDFGLFKMMSNAVFSYRQLPIRVFELSPSYRLEKSGECVGLRRLRAFTMPDIHCFCRDLNQGMDEYKLIFESYTKLADSMGIDYVVAFRVVESFYNENRDWFKGLVGISGKPAFIELLPEMKHYWIVKHEYQFIDSVGGSAQLCTVQLDIEDSERYGIMYVDEDGSRRGCIIVHSSMGSIERWIYAILEQAAKAIDEGKTPTIPLWLSPIQVRIIPVSHDQMGYVLRLTSRIESENIRVDVDDREGTVSSKIRDAEREWIPYIVVVGKQEVEGGLLPVRVRGEGIKNLTLDQLIDDIKSRIGDKPYKPLTLPKLLSLRPKFIAT
jgi:threonyl-tRNA synthetase